MLASSCRLTWLGKMRMCYCPRMSSRTPNFTPARRPQQRANAREATRLRHSLPGLTTSLRERGWPIDSIKVNVKTVSVPASTLRTYQAPPPLPDTAVQSFAALAHTLAVTSGNDGLVNALNKLVSKRRG